MDKKETAKVVAKKPRVINTTITRNTNDFSQMTDNLYETVAMLSMRANQLEVQEKRELHKKIEEFATGTDAIDEMYENREQIEIVKHYEQMPKPVLNATQEYLDHKLFYKNPMKSKTMVSMMEELEDELVESAVKTTDEEKPKKRKSAKK